MLSTVVVILSYQNASVIILTQIIPLNCAT